MIQGKFQIKACLKASTHNPSTNPLRTKHPSPAPTQRNFEQNKRNIKID
jgi:hypothetical protein